MTEEIRIRPCRDGDEHALALIGQATFLETFAGVLSGEDIVAHCARAHRADIYREWLNDARYRLWLVECEPSGAPVGYLVLAPADLPVADPTPTDLELKRIYLLSRFRGGGIGKRLVAAAVEAATERKATRLLLGVYAHNAAAIGFYERNGFVKIGARKFRIGAREYDDNVMRLALV